MKLTVINTTSRDSRFIYMCSQMDKFLNDKVGALKQAKIYNQYNNSNDLDYVALVLRNKEVVACGALKRLNNDSMEVKRVFVKETCRRMGAGRLIMKDLEDYARVKKYNNLLLETGIDLKAAQKMYESVGFKVIENYAQYKNIDTSVCMKKVL